MLRSGRVLSTVQSDDWHLSVSRAYGGSGSQSQYRFCFIVPAHGASHTIKTVTGMYYYTIPIILMIHSAAGTASLTWAHFRSWNLFAINTAPAS